MPRTPRAEKMPASSPSNVLFLAHRVPYPPDKGDRIRTFNVLRFLSQRARVHLACLADEPVPEEIELALGRYCERVAIVQVGRWSRWFRAGCSLVRGGTASEGAFCVPQLRVILRRWANETRFDVCLASASSIAAYLRLKELRDVPAVIDFIDVDSQKWFDYAASCRGPRAWLYRTEGRRLRRLEQTISSWASAVTLVGEAEVDIYRQFCPDGPVHAISNGVDLNFFQPMNIGKDKGMLVFTGIMDYFPNVQGVLWFCREVLPLVRTRIPDATFTICGARPNAAVQALGRLPGVKITGRVPDVRPYLARAQVGVVPLQIARGIQNKLLEAMAMGLPIITTTPAFKGVGAIADTHLLVADHPADFAAAVVRLLQDELLRARLQQAARAFTEANYRWETQLARLDDVLTAVTSSPCSRYPKENTGHRRTPQQVAIVSEPEA